MPPQGSCRDPHSPGLVQKGDHLGGQTGSWRQAQTGPPPTAGHTRDGEAVMLLPPVGGVALPSACQPDPMEKLHIPLPPGGPGPGPGLFLQVSWGLHPSCLG